MSCTMKASTPASYSSQAWRRAVSSSWSKTTVLRVAKTFAPQSRASEATRSKASAPQPTACRAPKRDPPMYTASAPHRSARIP